MHRNPNPGESRRAAAPFKWLATALLLVAASCRPSLIDFYAPEHVASGGEFEVLVAANLPNDGLTSIGYAAGCVLQLPVGMTILGYSFEGQATPYYNVPWRVIRDDPSLLAFYTPEPGYVLASFHSTHPTSGHVEVPGFSLMRLRVRAANTATGAYTIKIALAGGDVGNWTAEQPVGVQQFSAITNAPFARGIQVGGRAIVDFHLQPSTSFPGGLVPSRAGSVGVADIDVDGFQDLFGGWQTPTGPVFEWHRYQPGLGWSIYGPSLPYPAGYLSPVGNAVIGDFDGDGAPDCVRSDGSTYFGGGGTFTAGQTLVGAWSHVPAVGDTNRDGFDDVLMIAPLRDLHLYRGSSSGVFTDHTAGLPTVVSSYQGLLLADLNGDNHLDIYLPQAGADNVFVGDGLGGWVIGSGVERLARPAVAADLDGDGVSELVTYCLESVATTSISGIRVYRSTSSTQWSLVQGTGLPSQGTYRSCALLDVNGDGAVDVAIGDFAMDAPGIKIFENLGNGTFHLRANTGVPSSGGVARIASGDFTNDGADDLIVKGRDGFTTFYASTRGPSAYRPIGPGCAGSAGLATNRSSGLPRIGQSSVVTIAPVPAAGLGLLLVGSNDDIAMGGAPLPLDLAPCGAPGCFLRVDGDVARFFATGSGALTFQLPIPPIPAFIGTTLYTQAVIFDNTNAFGLVTSQASAMTFGS